MSIEPVPAGMIIGSVFVIAFVLGYVTRPRFSKPRRLPTVPTIHAIEERDQRAFGEAIQNGHVRCLGPARFIHN